MREIVEENKKAIIALGICIVISLVLMFVTKVMNNNGKKTADVDEALNALSAMYYDDYYDNLSSYEDDIKFRYLERISSDGIKLNLAYFIRNTENLNLGVFINGKKGIYCDLYATNVIIYPVSPYGKNDYSVEINKACDIK